jgi:hypothetical protein
MLFIIAGDTLPIKSLSENQQWKKVNIQHIKFQAPAEILFYLCTDNSDSNILEVF